MDWRTVPNSLIWLHGIPGCGKTILSSTIIENVQEYCDRNRGNCLAYFYFAFNDVDRQRCVQMLRSLLDQLCRQDMAAFQLIESLFSSCGSGSRQPTNEQLLGALKRMIRGSSATYVVLDALDECTRRPELLETIQTIDGWQLDTLHMLVTSRLEGDIRETLETIPEIDTVNIQSSLVSEDIRTYICSRLSNDSSLRRWQRQIEIRKEIETELMEKAEGMYEHPKIKTIALTCTDRNDRFRWVECQLDALGKCVTLSMLRKALESLPSTLDETYARILCKIDESYRRLAIKAFKWLVYSQRPLEVQELVEVLAIDVEDEHPFDVDRRLPEHEDLLLICSSLVTVTSILETKSKTVRLAHFSVQEYLISENVLNGPAAMYAARYLHSHTDIAEECISYLRQIASEDSEGELSAAFPLAHYAAIYWIHHARIAGQEQEQRIATSAYELFQPDIFYVWARLVHDYSANHLYGTDFYNFPQRPFVLEELHYATDSGMPSLIEHVLNAGVELDTRNSNGYTSLHIAIRNRDLRIVKLLLDHGADINVFSEKVGPPLTLAAELGYEEIVTALLRHGVDINDVRHGTALIAAAKEGHSTVTRLLISEGADVNKFDPCTGTALIAAADQGHTEMAMELLAEGADVDASGPRDETALGVAAFHGNEKLVRMLLEAGADINLAQDYSGTALYAAALRRQPAIVRLLLENGAGVDENRFGHGTALQGASSQGYDEIVQLLLDKGANVNAEGGNFGTALQRASESGYESTTQLLLANGANVNIEGRFYWGTALQAASRGGYENVVRLLLDKGAEVQTQCGHHGNPLQAASVHGATSVVQLLRDRGARY